MQILACGTSYYAGLTARYWIEAIAGIPCSVEIASEYRYRKAVANPKHLIVTISQSGETLDTMEALKYAKSLGHDKSLSICNVPESAIPRASKLVYYTRAGAEIGVASTKAFTTQLVALFPWPRRWPSCRAGCRPSGKRSTWMRCATCRAASSTR